MGNRALVIFHSSDKKEFSPVVYLHWNGSSVPAFIEETKKLMESRGEDLDYAAARFIGVCHSHIEGNLSLGVSNIPKGFANNDAFLLTMSHGDNGVFLVNASDFSFRQVR